MQSMIFAITSLLPNIISSCLCHTSHSQCLSNFNESVICIFIECAVIYLSQTLVSICGHNFQCNCCNLFSGHVATSKGSHRAETECTHLQSFLFCPFHCGSICLNQVHVTFTPPSLAVAVIWTHCMNDIRHLQLSIVVWSSDHSVSWQVSFPFMILEGSVC
jgi:hypothetical protein